MVRFFSWLVGAGFVGALLFALVSSISGLITEPPQPTVTEEFHKEPKPLSLASDGPFGKYDNQQLQRGFQVYKEVCAACHSIDLVHFRDLEGIGYNKAEVKAIADQWVIEQPTINPDTGEASTRKNLPSDPFPRPFANDVAARAANNNALPPDLSLIVKAREGGAAYIHSILTGYEKPDPEIAKKYPDFEVLEGLHYNPYFPSLAIAMAQQINSDGQVQYVDGTKPTIDQMSTDVTAFLVWTAEPKLEARHAAGMAAVIFLLIFCFLTWGAYKNVWRNVEH
ncbi:ubiquinol-cytochrome c reductase cytochrome c1 subunit [Hephaestia caeni]|uniref:Cytochrome c1 n=1 Tax=Hephaestia caeni TaxID=645617 RepID=A0A397NJC6_9SPHN|nr:cytochrome c1 [Hephaestia caeni]RIA37610.1 ubiquinol-cytochrome c reductase cytochrome c1 subunit [Hephaestia caeni]